VKGEEREEGEDGEERKNKEDHVSNHRQQES
jgi:hypothetical protein